MKTEIPRISPRVKMFLIFVAFYGGAQSRNEPRQEAFYLVEQLVEQLV